MGPSTRAQSCGALTLAEGCQNFACVGIFQAWRERQREEVGPLCLPKIHGLGVIALSDGEPLPAHAVPAPQKLHALWRRTAGFKESGHYGIECALR